MKSLSEEKILNYLRDLSVKTGLTVNDLRVVLALERAVARIEADHTLAEGLIFKGGFLLFKSVDTEVDPKNWTAPLGPTPSLISPETWGFDSEKEQPQCGLQTQSSARGDQRT